MTAGLIFVIVLGGLAVFQVAMVSGAPWGRFVWGGQHRVLPTGLRVGTALGIVLYAVFAVAILDRADVIDVLSGPVASVGAWIVFGFMALSVFPNAISRSKHERYTMTPIVLVLAVTSLLVAVG